MNGTATILLPSYFDALAMKNDRTVQLTPKDGWSPLYVDGLVSVAFTVKTTKDGNPSQKFYWTVFAKRGDITVEK